ALYGNIIAFLVNLFITTFMFYLKPAKIFLAQVFAAAVLFVGLPYYQPSTNILIGHYANGSIFIIFLLYFARTNYIGFVQNFINQKIIEEKSLELTQINARLMNEIQISERVKNELATANQQLRIISSLDALTGIPNRRRLDEVLLELWSKAVAQQYAYSIMMIDIDFFKRYNDTHGHLAGDRCLQAVAEVLNHCRRESLDFVARFGGEEFIFVTVGLNRQESLALAERIRAEVEALGIEHQSSSVASNITVSIGISHLYPNKEDRLDLFMEKADKALYQAKADGRNRLVLFA
ncbi:MAG TPA: diguanylate cyclase, partial [Syntrophomonas sp.]|nr:diguanylate cyclase [Syntrophomonas sp.]